MRLIRRNGTNELLISEEGGLSGPIYIWFYLCLAFSARSEVGGHVGCWAPQPLPQLVVCKRENNNADSTLNEARQVKIVTWISGRQ